MPMDPEVLLAHRDFVRALARRLLVDDDRVEDVVQQTWLAALERKPTTDRSLKPWLAAVARNFARIVSRAESRRTSHERAAARRDEEPSAAEIVERELARRKVVDAVLALDEPYRATILFRYFEDLSPREIARCQGVPVETVKTRLKRGLDQLRVRLDREHGGDRGAWCLALVPLARSAKATTLAAAFTGGLLMKLGTKVAIVAVVLLVAILVARWAWSPPSSETTSAAREVAPSHPSASRKPIVAGRSEFAPAPSGTSASTPAMSGVRLTGRVVDQSARAVAGARVVAYPDDVTEPVRAADADQGKGRARAVVTDASGRFVVALPESAAFFTLVAEADGFSPTAIEPVRADDDLTITLDPARALVGHVMDIEGRPIAGATVRWFGLFGASRIEREGRSRDDGSYRLENLPSKAETTKDARYWFPTLIEATCDGFAPLVIMHEELRETDDLIVRDLVLVRGATVKGRVVDAETDKPLAGSRIVSLSIEGRVGHRRPSGASFAHVFGNRTLGDAIADKEGRFTLDHVSAKGFHVGPQWTMGEKGKPIVGGVIAIADGHAPAWEDVLFVSDGTTLEIEIRCWPSAAIRGRVVDAGGRPLANVRVSTKPGERRCLALTEPHEDVASGTATTDADGRYVLRAVPAPRKAEAEATVAVTFPGSWTESTVEVAVRAGKTTEAPDLVAAADRSAVVTLVDEQGRSISRATIAEPDGAILHADASGVMRFFFAELGRYGLHSVTKRLIVSARGYATAVTPAFTPTVDAPPDVRVVLAPEHRLAGKIVLDDGSAAVGADVLVLNHELPIEEAVRGARNANPIDEGSPLPCVWGHATVAADGSFVVEGLPDATFNLRARRVVQSRRGGPVDTAEIDATDVAADSINLTLTLRSPRAAEPTALVEGTVVDARSGKPVTRFGAFLVSAEQPYASHADVLPGRFRFEEAPVGTWTLRVEAEGYPSFERRDLVIGPDGVREPLRIRLDRGVRVFGRLRGPEDLVFADATIQFIDASESSVPQSRIAADGAFEVTGFRPGHYLAVVEGPPIPNSPNHERAHWAPVHPVAVDIDEMSRDVECDLTVGRCGSLCVLVQCSRLPRPPWDAKNPTEEQVRTSAASRAAIHASDGRLVTTWSRVTGGGCRGVFLPPGTYTVIVEIPGAEPQEKVVTVEVDQFASATLTIL